MYFSRDKFERSAQIEPCSTGTRIILCKNSSQRPWLNLKYAQCECTRNKLCNHERVKYNYLIKIK